MKHFDVIVVGGGTGGCLTAAALAKSGYITCILDQKKREAIGKKVCGDAVGRHHLDNLGIAPPQGDELNSHIVGIDIYSPDRETRFRVRGEGLHGYVVDRLHFGQRLLQAALDQGVELFDRTLVLDPLFQDEYVVGVKAKSFKTRTSLTFRGKTVVDASGVFAVLRKKMPEEWYIEREVDSDECEKCYREIREVDQDIEDPDFLQIYLDQEASPGGYYWIFPKGHRAVNVGLGVQMSLPVNPRTLLYKQILSQPFFKNSKVLDSGGGVVSTRRPIHNMVGNGILFVGDTACQPNPIHGGGIGPSMLSGTLAAQVLTEALETGDVSRMNLWSYNKEYMSTYGAKSAGLDIFRIFLQTCSNADLNDGMKNRLLKEEDLLKASIGEELHLNITDKAQRVFRGLQRLSFLRKLSRTATLMRRVRRLYRRYPQYSELVPWIQDVDKTFTDYEQSLK